MRRKFEVSSRKENAAYIIAVSGDVDMESSPALRAEIQRALKTAKCVKLDLKAVSYLDSSGVAVLIQGLKWAQKIDVEYRLLDPSSQAKAVIELAQLQQLFTIDESPGGDE